MWKEKAQMHTTNKEKALYVRTYDVANLPQASTNFNFCFFFFFFWAGRGVKFERNINQTDKFLIKFF